MNDVARNIRRYREQKKLTQDELAERLHVTRQAVSNWETGKNHPDLDMLSSLAQALDLELTDLFYGKRQEYPRFQKKAVIWVIALGTIALFALIDGLFIAPYLLRLQARTFNSQPRMINELVVLPVCCLAFGMLLPALVSLWRNVQLDNSALAYWAEAVINLTKAFVLLIPAFFTALCILTNFQFLPSLIIKLVFADSIGFRRGLFLNVFPFLAGLCLYPAFVRLKKFDR